MQRFFLCSILDFWSTQATLVSFTLLNYSLRWDAFLPEFSRGEAHLFETCTLRFDPKNCVLFG